MLLGTAGPPQKVLLPTNGVSGSGNPQYGIAPGLMLPVPSMAIGPGPTSSNPTAGPTALLGQTKTPVIDTALCASFSMSAHIERIITAPAQTDILGGVLSPATLQLEGSNDGNNWWLLTSTDWAGINTTALTQHQDGSLYQNPIGKSPFRYIQGRVVYAGGGTAVGTVLTAPATNVANCTACKFTPDMAALIASYNSTPYLIGFAYTQSTSVFATGVNSAALTAHGAANGAMDIIGPFGTPATYYVLLATGTSPYWAIVPYTVASGFQAANSAAANITLAGAGLCCKWVPAINNPKTQVAIIGVTGAPGIQAFMFDTTTGNVIALNTLLSATGVTLPTPGPNVNGLDVSLDGAFMVTAESATSGQNIHLYTLNGNALVAGAINQTLITGYAPPANMVVAAAQVCVAIHPSGEQFVCASAANMYFWQVFRNPASYASYPYNNTPAAVPAGQPIGYLTNITTATNPAGILIGPQSYSAVAGGLGNIASLAYSHDGGSLAFNAALTPFVKAYPTKQWATGGGIGTAYAAITAIVNATAGLALCFSPDDSVLMVGNTSIAAGALSGWPWLMRANIGVEVTMATPN